MRVRFCYALKKILILKSNDFDTMLTRPFYHRVAPLTSLPWVPVRNTLHESMSRLRFSVFDPNITNVRLFLLAFSHIIKSHTNHWSRWPSQRSFVFNSVLIIKPWEGPTGEQFDAEYERTSILKCWYTIKLALRCKYTDLRLVKTWMEITSRYCYTASIGATTHRPRGLMKVWSMERNGQPKRLSSVHSYHAGQHIRGLYRPISTRVSGQIGIICVKKFEQDLSSITWCKIYVEMLRSFRDQNLWNCSTSGLNRKSRSNGVILCVAFFELLSTCPMICRLSKSTMWFRSYDFFKILNFDLL